MLQIFSNNISEIVLDNQAPNDNVDMVNSHIKLCNCENMTVDITRLNIIDACMVSTVCSATHYLKYPNGKIFWRVNSPEVEEYTASFGLGNSKFIY